MMLTLSKFFSKSIILPSTSAFERPAGAEYHLIGLRCDVGRLEDFTRRHGVVIRETGNCDLAAHLLAHRADCRRAVLIMVKVF